MDNNLSTNKAEIVGQPKQNFHFRYECDKKKHKGFITNGTPDQCPQIRFSLPTGSDLDDAGNQRKFYILSSIHSYWNNSVASLSPHVLEKAADGPVKYEFVFEEMHTAPGNPLEKYWVLDKYVIRRIKIADFQKSLMAKSEHYRKLGLPLDFERLKGNVDFENKVSVNGSGILDVALGFTIFEKDVHTNLFRLYSDTVYSNNIIDGDDLNTELCNIKGSVVGGTKMYILGNFNNKHTYTVHFTNPAIGFEKRVKMSKIEVVRQTALKFVLPKGPILDASVEEIQVTVKVVVNRSTYQSAGMKFYYENKCNDDELPYKRQRMDINEGNAHPPVHAEIGIHVADPPRENVYNNDEGEGVPLNRDNVPSPRVDRSEDIWQPNVYQEIGINVNDPPSEYVHRNGDMANAYEDLPLNPEAVWDHELKVICDFDLSLLEDNNTESNEQEHISRDGIGTESNDAGAVKAMSSWSKKNSAIAMPKSIPEIISHILSESENVPNIVVVGLNGRSGNTIFHEAIMDEENLLHLYRLMKTTQRKQLVLKARNAFRENLLHYACLQNQPQCIRPLIAMGCGLHEQDGRGRTPLHIAIDYNNSECISKFQDVLKSHAITSATDMKMSEEKVRAIEQLLKMFKVYNDQGFTVLHAAIMANLLEMIRSMLEFCQLHKLDVLQYEVLGNGDSIYHLMVKGKRLKMMELVKQYVPFDEKRTNYTGQTVGDIYDLSSIMSRVLTFSPKEE